MRLEKILVEKSGGASRLERLRGYRYLQEQHSGI